MIKMAVLGAGKIAQSMSRAAKLVDGVECYAVASRSLEKAEKFAADYGFARAYGSYEEMVKDPEVQLVYVATPHSHHYEHARLCLEHGKHVFCEKAFTVNEKQAVELVELARAKGLFLAEAMKIRFVPLREKLNQVLASGVIGTPHMMTANLSYAISSVERLVKPELAGGALLDVGCYALNFAAMAFGTDVEKISGEAVLNEYGVDMQNSITLIYKDGRMAVLNSGARGISDRRGVIYGDCGFVEVTNINCSERIDVFDQDRNLVASYESESACKGMEHELAGCIEALEQGSLECPQMPLEETLRMMRWMDELRRQWEIVYPMEDKRIKDRK